MDGRVAFDGETLAPAALPANPETAGPDALAALLPTGGTTGVPKVVPLTHRNVVASATATMLALDLRPEDRFVIVLPLFHVGGAFCGSLPALGIGATMVLPTAGGFPQSRRRREFLADRRGSARDHRRRWCRPRSAPPPRRPRRAATCRACACS